MCIQCERNKKINEILDIKEDGTIKTSPETNDPQKNDH